MGERATTSFRGATPIHISLAASVALACDPGAITTPDSVAPSHAQVTATSGGHYYVSPAGNDANPCSAVAPCFTMLRVGELLAPGDTAHFAPGNYSWSAAQTVSASGTESAHVTYLSDSTWGAKLSGACSIISNSGDYVDIVGFDVTGPPTCVNGINQRGNHGRIIGNRVHDLPGSDGTLGGGFAAIVVDCCDYTLTGNEVIGNVVDNIGPALGLSNVLHGIYLAGPGNRAVNNIVTRASASCIHSYHGATRLIIANNTVANCGRYGILISADPDVATNDSTTVANNIVVNMGKFGVYESPFGSSGTHNRYYNNIVYNNPDGNVVLTTGTQDSTITLTDAEFDALFVNYTGDMTGDYHLQAGARGIDEGTTRCAPGTTACVPPVDFDGVSRPQGTAWDIGAYERQP